MNAPNYTVKLALLTTLCSIVFVAGMPASAAPLSLADTPLFLSTSAAPLNMLVMGRDHKLYYEAYNDHSDLDDDDVLDVGYKPDNITYFGYFDPKKCYTYDNTAGRFIPAGLTSNKKCSNQWSGDWLNYVTTSRMDALRKVLYGGYRSTDTTSDTTLERAFVPQDAHSWGKSYTSIAVDGYNLTEYTPLPLPASNKSHLFSNTTLNGTTAPLLRYLKDQQYSGGTPLKVWNWLSTERPVAGNTAVTNITSGGAEVRTDISSSITNYTVRVKVCDNTIGLEANCQAYTDTSTSITTYKPTGLLQSYGENDTMKFGLISGSYANNLDGGVLRKAVKSFKDEVNLNNGTFIPAANGIVATLNGLKIAGFKSDGSYDCNNSNAWVTTRSINNGECQNWGNPVAEMMYEGLRYFAGKSAPTSAFAITAGAGQESGLNLPVATWDSNTDPYKKAGSNPNGSCAKPFETVISDVNTSYDTDKLPGTAFSTFTGDLAGLNVSTLGQTIWNGEFGTATTKNVFIGEISGSSITGPAASAPTAKNASSFGNIRGLAPEEPTKQGGYYAASVAYHGLTTDINTTADAKNTQNVATFVVALASPLPRIEIKTGSKKITLIPFAKSVAGASIDRTSSFQPTNQIVDFYVDSLTATSGKFRVNYEDVEQGADHDMDAIVLYEYLVKSDGTVDVTLTSEYAAGGITQHMGYIISGTTKDGIYLEVADQRGGDTATDVDYGLDTPPGISPGGAWNDGRFLPKRKSATAPMEPLQPIQTTRNFTAGATTGAELLQDPLWYAAKWGGFTDSNKDGKPNPTSEWDAEGSATNGPDGNPDNYFLVTNALTLGAKLSSAFNEILKKTASASSASVNSGSISTKSRVYQATFDSGEWTGHLLSFPVATNGLLSATAEWDAADKIPTTRKIFTINSSGTAIPFNWANISTDITRSVQLDPIATNAQNILNYISGDQSKEANKSGGTFRIRKGVLGDLINSAPLFVGPPNLGFSDKIETASKYSTFRASKATRGGVIYAGGNDGMLHAFQASDGVELFAYIPSPVFGNLKLLSSPSYSHKYFVDGSPNMTDAYFGGQWRTVLVGGLNKGGQGIYALDITNPTTFDQTKVLWEFTDKSSQGADLGYTYSQPALVKLNNGKWAAIFGNGYNNRDNDGSQSTTGNAVLYIVNLEDGTLIRKLDTGAGNTATPNGLATPAVVDFNGDSIADFVYAGDLLGNLWKFDIQDADDSKWKIAYKDASLKPAPLYTATDGTNPQPITSRPEVARGPNSSGMAIMFGTGKYLESSDKLLPPFTPARTQSAYAIYDANTGADSDAFVGRSDLVAQTILTETAVTVGTQTSNIRITSENAIGSTKRGWYMDLISPSPIGYQAERVVSNPIYRDGRFIFTTLIPTTDPCDFGGSSWLIEVNALTGTRLKVPPVDLNGDGKIDSADLVNISGVPTIVSAIQSKVGITPEPGILTDPNKTGVEYKYFAGTSGEIQTTVESRDPLTVGRQSWKQLR